MVQSGNFPYHPDMDVQVECKLSGNGEQEPEAFTLGSVRYVVEDLLDRWPGRSDSYYKVRVADGRVFILRHRSAPDAWEIAALVGSREVSVPEPARTRH